MKDKIREALTTVAIYATLGGGLAIMTTCNIMSAWMNKGIAQMPESLTGLYGRGFGLMIVGLILLVSERYGKEKVDE